MAYGRAGRTARSSKALQFRSVKWHRDLRVSVYTRDDFTCQGCGASSEPPDKYDGRYTLPCYGGCGLEGNYLQIDHITPRSRGGTHDPRNLQTLCHSCNSAKSDRGDF